MNIVNKLLDIDSLLNVNKKILSNRIIKEYETPQLLREKEELLQKLNQKNRISSNRIIILVVFSGLLILALLYYIWRNYVYKKRFKTLMKEKPIKEKLPSTKTKDISIDYVAQRIPKEILDTVLKKLSDFEKANQFLNSNYTLTVLAKELKTNSTYLSKIINTHKGMNFSSYITLLRINYAIEEIKKSNKFDHYSVEGIAVACGFKSYSSFAKAFYKATGLHPSYFLKQIIKERTSK